MRIYLEAPPADRMGRRNALAALATIYAVAPDSRFAATQETSSIGTGSVAWLDVRDFGARGTSESEETTALQRALDQAGATSGALVYIPHPSWDLSI